MTHILNWVWSRVWTLQDRIYYAYLRFRRVGIYANPNHSAHQVNMLKEQLDNTFNELSEERRKSERLERDVHWAHVETDRERSRSRELELALECEHDRGKRLERKCARLKSALARMAERLVESD